jgi:uncharacterized membrane protein
LPRASPHLAVPGELLKITPAWVPFAPQVIFVTGLCEVAGAVALVMRPLLTFAGIALARSMRLRVVREFQACVRWHRHCARAVELVVSRAAACR